MRQMLRLACVVAAGVLLVPGMARAQGHIGIHAYGIVDLDALAAKQSFEAVLGTSQLKAFGGGVGKTPYGRWRPILCLPRRTSLRSLIIRGQISNSAHAACFGG